MRNAVGLKRLLHGNVIAARTVSFIHLSHFLPDSEFRTSKTWAKRVLTIHSQATIARFSCYSKMPHSLIHVNSTHELISNHSGIHVQLYLLITT